MDVPSQSVGLHKVADYWNSVVAINDYQKQRFVEAVISSMFNTISGKRIAVFGFAFKKVPPLVHPLSCMVSCLLRCVVDLTSPFSDESRLLNWAASQSPRMHSRLSGYSPCHR